ncbi:MAG: hypothetical protein IKV69_00625 [Clostridia bacterium]|nr:hypothetical protein [Clostridia bacterium]
MIITEEIMERKELDGVSFVDIIDEYHKRIPEDKSISTLRKSMLFMPDSLIDKEILNNRDFEYSGETGILEKPNLEPEREM